jgi:hypothetical protein
MRESVFIPTPRRRGSSSTRWTSDARCRAIYGLSFESIRLTAKQDLGIDFNDMGIADNFVHSESV